MLLGENIPSVSNPSNTSSTSAVSISRGQRTLQVLHEAQSQIVFEERTVLSIPN